MSHRHHSVNAHTRPRIQSIHIQTECFLYFSPQPPVHIPKKKNALHSDLRSFFFFSFSSRNSLLLLRRTCHLRRSLILLPFMTDSTKIATPLKSTSVHSQIKPESQFEFVTRDTEKSEQFLRNCNTWQHTPWHCNTLRHTATRDNILQETATHCTTLQHTCASHLNSS